MSRVILSEKELLNITGGAITATFVNAITKGVTTLLDLGRAIGSAIRRISSNKICSI